MSSLLAVIFIVAIVYFLFRNVNKTSNNKENKGYDGQGRSRGKNYDFFLFFFGIFFVYFANVINPKKSIYVKYVSGNYYCCHRLFSI